MAYNSAYKYDIFISYAHDDNVADAWVTQFYDYLYDWLDKKRHLKGLKIWFDDENLKGSTRFDESIKTGITDSALFFVLHSHNYLDSEYCRKELSWFLEENNKHPNGIKVGEESRVFNVLINNIHYQKWSKDLEGMSGFPLHDAEDDGEYGFPTAPDEGLFNKQMRKILDATASILDNMPKEKTTAKKAEKQQNDDRPKIFIADVADTLRPFRKRLINEIGNKAVILPSLPPPYEAVEHQAELNKTLQESSLSIHLLDQWAGRQIDDDEDVSFPRLQADTAINTAQESLIWVPDTLELADIEDEQQADWLQQLENNNRSAAGFHFVRSDQQDFIQQIKQTIDKIQDSSQAINDTGTFLIDTHQKDVRFAFQLANLLSDKDIEVEFNKESKDPVQGLENFEYAVKEVQNLIIMFGGVAPTWLKGRIEKAVKILANQRRTGATTLEAIWICLLPNSPGIDALGNVPVPLSLKINLLDNTSSAIIDDSIIALLLNASGKAKQ